MQIKVWLHREQYANSQQREEFPVLTFISGDGRTKSEYKIKIWIHWKVGGNLFDSRGFESFRGEFLRRRCSIDFEINRMRDPYGGGKNISSSSERNIHVTEKNKKKFAMKFFVRFSFFIYLFILNFLLL